MRTAGFSIALVLTTALAAHAQQASKPIERYESARVDANGNLVIVTTDGRTIHVAREGDQTTFRDPKISEDRTAVGAQADSPNCCTSYDIPRQLIVYADGQRRAFISEIGWPIFEWGFADGGSRISFGSETVHFACYTLYELWEIRSMRQLAKAEIPQSCGQIPNPKPVPIPRWVREIRSRK